MNRFLYALLITMSIPGLSLAASGITVGGGLNSSSTDGDVSGVDYSNRIGFNLGIGFEMEASPVLSFLPEINLETRGEFAKMETTPFGEIQSRLKLLYLQIPVFMMLKAPLAGVTVNAFAGPAIGILLSANVENEIGGEEESMDIHDEMNLFDFGIEMGVGVEFPAASGTFFFRPSYYLGLMNVEDSEEESDIRLRNIKIKVGYKFPFMPGY